MGDKLRSKEKATQWKPSTPFSTASAVKKNPLTPPKIEINQLLQEKMSSLFLREKHAVNTYIRKNVQLVIPPRKACCKHLYHRKVKLTPPISTTPCTASLMIFVRRLLRWPFSMTFSLAGRVEMSLFFGSKEAGFRPAPNRAMCPRQRPRIRPLAFGDSIQPHDHAVHDDETRE